MIVVKMKKFLKKRYMNLYKNILVGKVQSDFYKRNKAQIDQLNYKVVKQYSAFAFMFCLIWFLVTGVSNNLFMPTQIYMLFTIIFGVELEVALIFVKKKKKLLDLLYYIICSSIYSFTFFIGLNDNSYLSVAAFFIAVIALPVPYIDKPIYAVIMTSIANIAYIIGNNIYIGKSVNIFNIEGVNVVVILTISCAYIVFTKNILLENIQAKLFFETKSRIDKLTGIYNKETTEQLADTYFLFLENHNSKSQCALFVLDLDNFKNINDRMGHQVGDEVLNCIGDTLKSTFRGQDITGRIGGDEFVVLMKDIDNISIVEKRAEILLEKIEKSYKRERKMKYSCSIGIAVGNSREVSYQQLFVEADKALYEAKGKGKGNYVLRKYHN